MNGKKYGFGESEYFPDIGKTLRRIISLKSFKGVKKGEIGGWIEKESNLSQEGEAWVYQNAKVFDNAVVTGNARIWCEAKVYGTARVSENVSVWGSSEIYRNARVDSDVMILGAAKVYGDTHISGHAEISNNAEVYGCASIVGRSRIRDKAIVCGNSFISGDVEISGNSIVRGDADISQNVVVTGNAKISGDVVISGNVCIEGESLISKDRDIFSFNGIGNWNHTITCTRAKNNKVQIHCGTFVGDMNEFEKYLKEIYVKETYRDFIPDYALLLPFIKQREKEWSEDEKQR